MNKKYFTEEEKREAKNKRQKIYDYRNKEIRKIKAKEYYKTHQDEKGVYQEKNKEKIKDRKKEYYQRHKSTIKLKVNNYNKNHKKERNEYINNKLKNNLNFKLSHNLRSRLYNALKNSWKSGSAVRDLGCSIPEFKTYLESKWAEGMTWKNWSKTGWHIDHIVPLDFFNLQNKEELLKACHYTNLQPMWAEENLSKGSYQNNK